MERHTQKGTRRQGGQGDKGEISITPGLQYFAQPGREIVIVFDQDEKVKTQASVIAARERLASCFREACCKVLFLSWDDDYKGVDDAIAALGSEWFKEVWGKRNAKPASIKVERLENPLPEWSEKGLVKYFEELYKEKMLYDGETEEWYLYSSDKEGIWSKKTNKEINQRLILELSVLLNKIEDLSQQIGFRCKKF